MKGCLSILITIFPGCPRFPTFHHPDVMKYVITWFAIHIYDLDYVVRLPGCMQRHLFEHTKTLVRHVCGGGSWNVRFDDLTFFDDVDEFLLKKNVMLPSYLLFRHVGGFSFETFLYDVEGFSLVLDVASVREAMTVQPV
ncbi:unnamed protein product [Cuscuta epithymum]|uniref:Uncharacterized protein n=1 Tax=Cuscuta epithymum TaxID=186058 RepID=A0AAV0FQA6_9ASTE|nr:unnamed protein product [Cuscuta epithymum]